MKKNYFCDEPWIGLLSVRTNGECICCPCYAKVSIGNLNESSIGEIWNSPKLIEMRNSFTKGELPEPCKGQLCPVVVGENSK
ncbi:MAG TPA: SPASM domain-containing protein [Ignavibacteriaceae bacterium]|nr:SPASM domain-containing protein [Ignavibacteriaceae bacterium]